MSDPRIELSQSSLFFPLPLSSDVCNVVSVRNLEDKKVAFKIRTSIRHRYTVRPTMHVLHPKDECQVRFTYVHEAKPGITAPDANTKDRFTIEAVFANDNISDKEVTSLFSSQSPSTNSRAGSAGTPGSTRKVLQCSFTAPDPKTMVMEERQFALKEATSAAQDSATAAAASASAAAAAAKQAASGASAAAAAKAKASVPASVPQLKVPPTSLTRKVSQPAATAQKPLPPPAKAQRVPGKVLEVDDSYVMRVLLARVPKVLALLLVLASFLCPFVEDPAQPLLR